MCASLFAAIPAITHAAESDAGTGVIPTAGDMNALLCQNNAKCLSYEPAVNPLLLNYHLFGNAATPVLSNNADGTCAQYVRNGTVSMVYGCVKNGVFTITGNSSVSSNPIAGTGAAPTEITATDSTGKITTTTTGPGAPSSCGITNFGACADDLLNSVAFFILGFSNFVLGVAGVLLNWVVVKTVFQFSQLIGNSEGLLTAWRILRDIGNLLLLFGFVLMGIGTILDTSKLPDKKAIPTLIIFAVLLNFSIFAAEAVIDTSNVLTSVLYSQANTHPCVTEICDINDGIAGHIMQSTGLSSIYSLQDGVSGVTVTNKVLIVLGLTIFSTVGIVVLLATAFMLAFRAVVLTGLIILSPIGFAGMALPPLKKMASRWWNALIHQAFFAPILFLLIFIDLKVTEGFSSVSNNHNLATALAAPGTDNMGIIMVFLLITMGLLAALMAAKSFGAAGANYAISTAGKIAGGTSMLGGGGAFIGRRTIGASSAAISRGIKSRPIGATWYGKAIAGVADKGASSSFDARAALPKKMAIGKMALPDLGKPNKVAAKGYNEIEKQAVDARTKYAAGLSMTPEAKAREGVLNKDKEAATNKAKKDTTVLNDQIKNANTAWSTTDSKLSQQISDLEKLAANGTTEQARLESEIAAQKARQNSLWTDGKTEEAMQATAAIDLLEKQQETISKAPETLKELREERDLNLEQHNSRVQALESTKAKIVLDEKKVQEDLDKEILMNNPKGIYANRLENDFINKLPGVAGEANRKAAEKIKADFKKTKTDKGWEGIKKALESKEPDAGAKLDAAIGELKAAEEAEGAAK